MAKHNIDDAFITDVLASFDITTGQPQITSKITLDNLRNYYNQVLQNEKGKKSNIDSSDLVKIIRSQLLNKFIPQGEFVGVIAGLSVGQQATQAGLNEFHSAGRTSSQGLPRVLEILGLITTASQATPTTTIHFKQKLTFDQITSIRKNFVGTNVEKLVKNVIIEFNDSSKVARFEWHSILRMLDTNKAQISLNSIYVMRLHLDVEQLVMNQIRPVDIANVIESSYPNLYCFYSPISIGIVDIYFDETIATSQEMTNEELKIHIHSNIRPMVLGVHLFGIKGILQANPFTFDLLGFVSTSEKDNNLVFQINEEELRTRYIDIVHYEHMMLEMGFNRNEFQRKGNVLTINGRKIGEIYAKFEKTENKRSPTVVEMFDFLKTPNGDPKKVPFEQAHFLWYLETIGSNIRAIVNVKGVDRRFTYTSDLWDEYSAFGIQSIRNSISRQLNTLLSGKVLYRHLSLLADWMCRSGKPLPFTYQGFKLSGKTPFALLTYERVAETIKRTGIRKQVDTGISTSVGLAVKGIPQRGQTYRKGIEEYLAAVKVAKIASEKEKGEKGNRGRTEPKSRIDNQGPIQRPVRPKRPEVKQPIPEVKPSSSSSLSIPSEVKPKRRVVVVSAADASKNIRSQVLKNNSDELQQMRNNDAT